MTLIDTSVWIEFLRARGDTALKSRVADLISFGEAAYTCPIRFELLFGARPKEVKDLRTGLSLAHHVVLIPQHWDASGRPWRQASLRRAFHPCVGLIDRRCGA
jgi:predicted nucleic acid-binding protein